jgi:hypothetical protein
MISLEFNLIESSIEDSPPSSNNEESAFLEAETIPYLEGNFLGIPIDRGALGLESTDIPTLLVSPSTPVHPVNLATKAR